jgi:hypothetical protein
VAGSSAHTAQCNGLVPLPSAALTSARSSQQLPNELDVGLCRRLHQALIGRHRCAQRQHGDETQHNKNPAHTAVCPPGRSILRVPPFLATAKMVKLNCVTMLPLTMLTGKNLVAGETVDAVNGGFTATGALAHFEEASRAHVDSAADASAGAFDAYRRMPADARAAFLDRIATAIEANDELIGAGTRGDGASDTTSRGGAHPHRQSTTDVRGAGARGLVGRCADRSRASRAHAAAETGHPPASDSDRAGRGVRREQLPAGVLRRGR